MDEDDKELVGRLMARATAMLEGTIEVAVAGQSGRLSAPGYVRTARQLQAAARDITIIADAAVIVANSSVQRRRNRRKSRR